ncbi:hypothetical protein NZK33_12880 [Cyanobium sp. FGCU-6]|nr:hypothetical protein [Cyanobium sp. FGCU6]
MALLLQPAGVAATPSPSLGPDSPGDHRLDGVLWPQRGPAGMARRPVVKLELQMQRDTSSIPRCGTCRRRWMR